MNIKNLFILITALIVTIMLTALVCMGTMFLYSILRS